MEYDYMLLSRLQADCDYYLGNGNKGSSLWGGSVKEHIATMKDLWNKLKVKPEWLTFTEIETYETKMS